MASSSFGRRALSALLPASVLAFACSASPPDASIVEENVASAKQALITGEVGQWKWTSVPGTHCGDGSETGFAVNLGTSDEVVIAMMGGGLCWDEITCNIEAGGVPLAMWFKEGFNESTFFNKDSFHRQTAFVRSPDNPYKDATLVYIPYCTGDAHLGNAVRTFPISQKSAYFKGADNLDLFLAQLVPAFTGAARFTLMGVSAGAIGATVHYDKIRQAFGGTRRMDLVADSGPILYSQNALWYGFFGQWGASASIPTGCTDCATNLKNIYAYNDNKYPDARIAILSHSMDPVIAISYPQFPYPQFYNSLKSLSLNTLQPLPQTKFFIPNEFIHTLLAGPGFNTVAQPRKCDPAVTGSCSPIADGASVTLSSWLQKMHDDDPTWSNVTGIINGVCVPSCGSATCGADGCGGVCGTCPTDMSCHTSSQCLYSKGCTIGGVNYDSGATNPAASCQVCDPSANPFGWTVAADSCFIGGQCKTAGQQDPGTACTECRPGVSKTSWSVGSSCNVVAVTNTNTNGDFGYSNAATACATLGASQGLTGTWKPLLATGSQSYLDVVPLARRTKPVLNLRGEQLFASWTSVFTNQVFPSGKSIYTFDDTAYTGKVWTGAATDGSADAAGRCLQSWSYPAGQGWSTKGYYATMTWVRPKGTVADFSAATRQLVSSTQEWCDGGYYEGQQPKRIACVLTP